MHGILAVHIPFCFSTYTSANGVKLRGASRKMRLLVYQYPATREQCLMKIPHKIKITLAQKFRHGQNPVPRGVSPRVMALYQLFVRGLLTTDDSFSHPWNFCNFSPFCTAGRRQEKYKPVLTWSGDHVRTEFECLFFASARKQAQGLHFGLSERGKLAQRYWCRVSSLCTSLRVADMLIAKRS